MARLNYHHLWYFWRVASEGNLTRVAESIPVSQSSLSAQIRQLESFCGEALFERVGRGLQLTDAGRKVFTYASDIFARGEALETLLSNGLETEMHTLRIGMLTTLSRNFIDGLIGPLLQDASLRISIEADNLTGLLDGLARHQLDLVLSNANVRGGDEQIWQSQLLSRYPVSIIGPAGNKPDTPFPDGYRDQQWVLPTRNHDVRQSFEGYCARWDLTPELKAEANDMAMLQLLARNSGALSVLPSVVVRDEIAQGILEEYMVVPNTFASFYAITIRRSHPSPALRALFDSVD